MSDARRIAVVGACPYPVPQGSQVYIRETALAYQREGHETCLVTYGYGIGNDSSGIPIHRCANIPLAQKTQAGPSWAKPLLDILLTMTLRRVVREQSINEIDAHNYEGLLVALAAGKRPVTYHAHNAMSDELPHYFGGAKWVASIGGWLDRTFPKRANRVVVPHERLKEYLAACGCDEDRIEVVTPTIDPAPFKRPKRSTDRPTVIYAGNLDRYQNLEFLFAVMDKVRETCPDVELIIATSEKRRIPGATVVHTPDVETLAEVLAQDAVFVCPRISWSGFPIKLLNALAADLPIVCCHSAAHAPIKDGVNAKVVADNDVEAFAVAVVESLNKFNSQEVQEALMNTSEKSLIWEKLIGNYRCIFNEKLSELAACPICEKKKCFEDFSIEHIVPQALKGKTKTLICKKCNNDLGSEIDSHFVNFIKSKSFLKQDVKFKSTMKVGDEDSRITLSYDKGIKIHVPKAPNDPQVIEEIREQILNGIEIKLNTSFGYTKAKMKRSLLKAAYLYLFSKFGYQYYSLEINSNIRQFINGECDDDSWQYLVFHINEKLPFEDGLIPFEFQNSEFVAVIFRESVQQSSYIIFLPTSNCSSTNLSAFLLFMKGKVEEGDPINLKSLLNP